MPDSHPQSGAPKARWREEARPPLIGVSCDIIPHNGIDRSAAPLSYAEAVVKAGGLPVLLQPIESTVPELLRHLDGLVLTGGDDPRTEPFGVPSHSGITPVVRARQDFESSLIETVELRRPDLPVLGVCLGMQMLALHAGGRLDQFMPETTATHEDHWDVVHRVTPVDGAAVPLEGEVNSRHKQAIEDAGSMRVSAVAHDGVIEAVEDPSRPFRVGVQWHPERTADDAVGISLFQRLVAAARSGVS